MRARKFGKIFNISSVGGTFATPLGGWYHALKHALEGYSDSLRNELCPFGIDVIIIEPGAVETELSGIAADEAERFSGRGAYAGLVAKFRKSENDNRGSPPPRVIADLIIKSLNARHPATRLHGGGFAGVLLFMRRYLPDRMFDRIVMSRFR